MAYVIPSKRAKASKASKKAKANDIDMFPALCPAVVVPTPIDFTKLSFEEEILPIPERRFEPGWARLSFKGLTLHIETDYFAKEPTLDELASKAILDMKTRWIKFYTDRGEEPYDYDYEPPEPVEEDISDTTSEDYDSAEYFSD